MQDREDFRVRNRVKGLATMHFTLNQSAVSEAGEVRGNVGLRSPGHAAKIDDALWARSQALENGQPGGIGKRLEELRLDGKALGTDRALEHRALTHAREYIICKGI